TYMKIYRYPLLCWNITDNLICGRLVGTDYEMVNAHLSKLKAHFSDHLQREYAQDLSLPDPLTGARLKKINVKVRPSYEEKKGIFPVGHFINISVTAIFGSLQEEYSECYLPLLEQHFYFYQTDQLRPLIEHFARDHFNNMTPEDFYHYLMLPDPWLEEITVRIKPRTLENVFNKRNQDNIKTLLKIADKFPRKIKTSNIAPETAWERRRIVTQIVKKLEHERLSIVLIGEQGSGKTTILLEVARKFFSVTKASRQEGKYLWRTTPQRMIAGARYLGEWQETSEELMEELESTGDILWINNFVHLLAVGGEGPEDSIAAFMLPQLRQGVQIVSELTQQEWERVRQRLPAFAAHFHVITIPQLTKKQVFRILHLFSDYIDKQLHITIEESALYLAYRLLDRYVRYEAFPGKIITFLTSIINDMLVLNQKIINNEKVIKQFIQKTGLPSFLLRDDIPLDISALQNYFTENIIGQKQAIVQICEIIMVFKAGVNDPNKPIATLLFSGPTGVG
ncbi:MAG: hypothetical protein KAH77_01095, partial [Thiomargarita sp.]|nr:hypothetical protein [Thiomargarita sp.]